eukprot:14443169-Alexandrium_andersonii.AAC.2
MPSTSRSVAGALSTTVGNTPWGVTRSQGNIRATGHPREGIEELGHQACAGARKRALGGGPSHGARRARSRPDPGGTLP